MLSAILRAKMAFSSKFVLTQRILPFFSAMRFAEKPKRQTVITEKNVDEFARKFNNPRKTIKKDDENSEFPGKKFNDRRPYKKFGQDDFNSRRKFPPNGQRFFNYERKERNNRDNFENDEAEAQEIRQNDGFNRNFRKNSFERKPKYEENGNTKKSSRFFNSPKRNHPNKDEFSERREYKKNPRFQNKSRSYDRNENSEFTPKKRFNKFDRNKSEPRFGGRPKSLKYAENNIENEEIDMENVKIPNRFKRNENLENEEIDTENLKAPREFKRNDFRKKSYEKKEYKNPEFNRKFTKRFQRKTEQNEDENIAENNEKPKFRIKRNLYEKPNFKEKRSVQSEKSHEENEEYEKKTEIKFPKAKTKLKFFQNSNPIVLGGAINNENLESLSEDKNEITKESTEKILPIKSKLPLQSTPLSLNPTKAEIKQKIPEAIIKSLGNENYMKSIDTNTKVTILRGLCFHVKSHPTIATSPEVANAVSFIGTPEKLKELNNENLSSFISCLANFRINDTKIWPAVGSEIIKRKNDLNLKEIAYILCSLKNANEFLTVLMNNDGIFFDLEEEIIKKLNAEEKISPSTIADIVRGYAKSKNGSEDFYRLLERKIVDEIENIDLKNLCKILGYLGEAKNCSDEIFKDSYKFIIENILTGKLKSDKVAKLAKAYDNRKLMNADFLGRIETFFNSKHEYFDIYDVATIHNVFINNRDKYEPRRLWTYINKCVEQLSGTMEIKAISNLFYGWNDEKPVLSEKSRKILKDRTLFLISKPDKKLSTTALKNIYQIVKEEKLEPGKYNEFAEKIFNIIKDKI